MKTWVKLYTEINRDPKMGQLTWAERGIWSALLALAGDLDHRNGEGTETGQLDTLHGTAWRIRCDGREFCTAIENLCALNMVAVTDEVLFITHYAERQARTPSRTPAARRERKRRQRTTPVEDVTTRPDPSRPTGSTGVAVPPSESDTDTDTDTDTESDQSQSQNGVPQRSPEHRSDLRPISDLISPSLSADSDSLTDAARIEKAIAIRERAERGKLSAREEAQMRQWANDYGPAKLYEATRKAVFKKPTNFGAYLRKILES